MADKAVLRSPLLGEASALLAACAVTKAKLGDRRAAAELTFSTLPPNWGFLIFAGIGPLVQTVERAWFTEADLAAVREEHQLGPEVADALHGMRCRLDLDAAAEGSVVFPGEPVVSVEGPLAQVILVGALVQAVIASATYVATRAARLCVAAEGDDVVESSSEHPATRLVTARAAYVGGCAATTSALAAAQLGIPLRATTPDPVAKLCAAEAAPTGRKGHSEWGEAHFDRWVELNSEDAETELALRRSAGERATWFVGSLESHPMPTSRWDVVALQEGRAWAPRLGLDRDVHVLPGRKLVARYSDAVGRPVADVVQVATERMAAASRAVLIGQLGPGCPEPVRGALTSSPLKAPLLRDGKPAGGVEPLAALRERALAGLEKLAPTYRRLRNPAVFPVGVSPGLYDLRAGLFARGTGR